LNLYVVQEVRGVCRGWVIVYAANFKCGRRRERAGWNCLWPDYFDIDVTI
jgi:3-isopropylmalate dehydratase small subunit